MPDAPGLATRRRRSGADGGKLAASSIDDAVPTAMHWRQSTPWAAETRSPREHPVNAGNRPAARSSRRPARRELLRSA